MSGAGHQELEIKFLEVDRQAIVARLMALGAECVFDDAIDARYFDTPDKALFEKGQTLRLRREGPQAVLTHKTHVPDDTGAKHCHEVETQVADFDAVVSMLIAMGYLEHRAMQKHRSSYRLAQGSVEIDNYGGDYDFIPEFIELEATNHDDLSALAAQLGLDMADAKGFNAFELAAYYQKKQDSTN